MNLVLTGSSSGIGWETLKALLPDFDQVFLPVRNLEKANKKFATLPGKEKITLIPVDLSEMKSVKSGAGKILQMTDQIDVLINNAGGMYPAGKLTSEGLDLTFATNHLGHFLLTRELMPLLKKGKAKIINVSSEANRISGFPVKDFGLKKSSNTVSAYAKAKLYNVLFTSKIYELFESEGISAYSLHPGAVKTAFGSETSGLAKAIIRATQLLFISPKAGAQTTIFLAKTPKSGLRNGGYYIRKKPRIPSTLARDKELASALWSFSEDVLKNLGMI